MKNESDSPSMENPIRTELDFKYLWICEECDFKTYIMYRADTHQVETDHCFRREPVGKQQ